MEINGTHYCWVIGNTGFRESALYEKIESYLKILNEFNQRGYNWKDNQKEFFFMMQENNFMVNGSTSEENMKKAARLKTSPLEKLGLVDEYRNITEIGNLILNRTIQRNKQEEKYVDKEFFLENDGDIYINQLIKLQFYSGQNEVVKPFVLFLKYINEFKYLNYYELVYIIPLIINNNLYDYGKELIINYRKEKKKSDFDFWKWQKEHIIKHKDNICNIKVIKDYITKNITYIELIIYNNDIDKIKEFIKKLDDNGKSEIYSLKLVDLFCGLCSLKNNINDFSTAKEAIDNVISGINKTSKTQQKLWRKLIFGVDNKNKFNKKDDSRYEEFLKEFNLNIYDVKMEKFLLNFFDILWFIKIKNNLEDYADHNLRYLKLSNILESKYENGDKIIRVSEIYEVLVDKILNDTVVNNIIFDKEIYKKYLYEKSYKLPKLEEYDMKEIADKYIIKIEEISKKKITLEKPNNVNYRSWIESLNKMYIDHKVMRMIDNIRESLLREDSGNLLECLEYLKDRSKSNNVKLKNIIDTEADIPTIFEYLVWQSFLLFGDYKENPIDFANFSFDNNLKPVQHAGGGIADVIFKYSDHDLILEATLTNDENQRKLEMEPVPRHVAKYRSKVRDEAYCIFVAPFVDPNVAIVHRAFKYLPYYVKDEFGNYSAINGIRILPLSIKDLQKLIKFSIKNDVLYNNMKDNIFNPIIDDSKIDGYIWYKEIVEDKINKLNTKNKIKNKKIVQV